MSRSSLHDLVRDCNLALEIRITSLLPCRPTRSQRLLTVDRIESAGAAVHVLFVLFTLWLKSDKTFCAGARL
jgi:hypothetical protein